MRRGGTLEKIMKCKILITGSSGLVGRALRKSLQSEGFEVEGLDVRAVGPEAGDVRDAERVRDAVARCDGVVHLAAVSRVVWGEQDPDRCRSVNVDGLGNVLEAALHKPHRPWFIFASSREVYGQPEHLPATEDASLSPLNVYAHTKVAGEELVAAARRNGLRAAVIRLSNVYGSTDDHADRVIPAFARAAVTGKALRIDGSEHTFDFTHIDDVARGISSLVQILASGEDAPPAIHFVTGEPTTLGQLARMAIEIAASRSTITLAPSRHYDVARFWGSPERAARLLHWSPRVSLRDGLTRLIGDFSALLDMREEVES